MSNFFVGLRPATAQDTQARWGGGNPGERFRCGLCGHKFVAGNLWRAVHANGMGSPSRFGNFLICEACHNAHNGEDAALLRARAALEDEAERRFWWFRRE